MTACGLSWNSLPNFTANGDIPKRRRAYLRKVSCDNRRRWPAYCAAGTSKYHTGAEKIAAITTPEVLHPTQLAIDLENTGNEMHTTFK